MPGQRSEGQKQVIVMMRDQFLDEIDAKLSKLGYSDRATFIRDAVYKELARNGVVLPPELKTAPSRQGKGGRKIVTMNYDHLLGSKVAEGPGDPAPAAKAPKKRASYKKGKQRPGSDHGSPDTKI